MVPPKNRRIFPSSDWVHSLGTQQLPWHDFETRTFFRAELLRSPRTSYWIWIRPFPTISIGMIRWERCILRDDQTNRDNTLTGNTLVIRRDTPTMPKNDISEGPWKEASNPVIWHPYFKKSLCHQSFWNTRLGLASHHKTDRFKNFLASPDTPKPLKSV